jgi:hypothetical protein
LPNKKIKKIDDMSKKRKHLNNKNDNIDINENNIIVKVIKPTGLQLFF